MSPREHTDTSFVLMAGDLHADRREGLTDLSGCGALTSLPGLTAAGLPACTRCSGIPARFGCGCGREVTAGEHGRCWWCVLTELVADALAGPGGRVPARLRPPADLVADGHEIPIARVQTVHEGKRRARARRD